MFIRFAIEEKVEGKLEGVVLHTHIRPAPLKW